jgi:hypothetical protein
LQRLTQTSRNNLDVVTSILSPQAFAVTSFRIRATQFAPTVASQCKQPPVDLGAAVDSEQRSPVFGNDHASLPSAIAANVMRSAAQIYSMFLLKTLDPQMTAIQMTSMKPSPIAMSSIVTSLGQSARLSARDSQFSVDFLALQRRVDPEGRCIHYRAMLPELTPLWQLM